MDLIIGSNTITGTNGILQANGKNQIWLEVDDETTQALITMDIYNVKGQRIAKIRRNAWVYNKNDLYEITTEPSSLKLINKKTGSIVVEVKVVSKNKIEIPQGKFYTKKGNLLTITPQCWDIGGAKLSGNIISNCGTAVCIG